MRVRALSLLLMVGMLVPSVAAAAETGTVPIDTTSTTTTDQVRPPERGTTAVSTDSRRSCPPGRGIPDRGNPGTGSRVADRPLVWLSATVWRFVCPRSRGRQDRQRIATRVVRFDR